MAGQGYWDRVRYGRLSRRRTLQTGALGGTALALIAAGCSSTSKPQSGAPPAANTAATSAANTAVTSAATPAPRSGGTIRLGTAAGTGNLLHLDPQIDTPIYAQQLRLIYQGLVGYDVRSYAVRPQVAKSWEQPSPTDYVFALDPAVKWENKPPASGRAFTVDDVVYSLERVRSDNPRFVGASLIKDVKIQAVDAGHVRLSTPSPDAAFLPKLSSDNIMMMAKEVVSQPGFGDVGKLTDPKYAVGTGPFEVTAFNPDTAGEFKRSANYWKPGRPYLDGVYNPYIREYQGAYAGFQSGQLDVVIVPGQEVKSYLAKLGPNTQPLKATENGSLAFLAPNTKVKPFDDPRVTRALRLLIDYNEIKSAWAESWYGVGRLSSFLNPPLDAWDLSEDELSKIVFWKQPKDDAAKEAISLLKAAGFDSGSPLKFALSGRNAPQDPVVLAQLVQGAWKRFSQGVVTVDLNLLDQASYQKARAARDYAYFVMTQTASYVDPDGWFQQCYKTGASRNYWNNSDPDLDAQFAKEQALFDNAARKKLVTDIMHYMIDHSPGVTMAYHYYINGITPKVHDWAPEVEPQGQQYESAWLSA